MHFTHDRTRKMRQNEYSSEKTDGWMSVKRKVLKKSITFLNKQTNFTFLPWGKMAKIFTAEATEIIFICFSYFWMKLAMMVCILTYVCFKLENNCYRFSIIFFLTKYGFWSLIKTFPLSVYVCVCNNYLLKNCRKR